MSIGQHFGTEPGDGCRSSSRSSFHPSECAPCRTTERSLLVQGGFPLPGNEGA
jgi:hypothetical protein